MKPCILLALLQFLAAGTAKAQEISAAPTAPGAGGRLSLAVYLGEVRTSNPEIAASAALARAYAAKVPQSGLPMDPALEFERMYASGALGAGAAERNIQFRQEFRNPLKYRLQKRAASYENSVYAALGRDKANKVLAEAREAFFDYALLWKTERFYAENLELLKKFSRIAETRYAVSQGAQGDAIKAQVELSKALNMLITVQQEKETAAARLNALRNRPPSGLLPEPEEEPLTPAPSDYKALEAMALTHNPELAAAADRVKAAEKRLSLARAEYAPDFMFGWRRRSSGDAGMNGTYDASLGLTLPLWFRRNQAMTKEAEAERDMASAERDAVRNALLFDLKEAAVRLDYYARLAELYSSTVLPQAEESLKAAEAGYRAGRTDFLDLVDSNRTLLETKREYAEYVSRYAGWLGRIKAITGEGL